MGEIEELKQDAEEARVLLASATRNKWQSLLSVELLKIETKIRGLEELPKNEGNESAAKTVPLLKSYTTTIRNYSWDQSEKFIKIYVTLPAVQNIDKEYISCDFGKKSIELKVLHLENKNHELKICNLAYPINVEKSYHKIKSDMVIIFASKESAISWEAVTAEEKRILDAKKGSKKKESGKEDPTSGLVDIMKQMYDDGDDEMKRMINKTWYESQNKSSSLGGMPDMGGLGGMPGMGGLGGMADMAGLGGMPDMAGLGGMPDMKI